MQRRKLDDRRPIEVLGVGETMALVVPTGGEHVETAEMFRVEVGGAESNVMSHLAACGHRTEWVSAVGNDALGRRTLAKIERYGVDVSHVRIDDYAPTGIYIKDPNAGVSYYRRGSAASRMSPADISDIDWSRVEIVHISGITLALSESCSALIRAIVAASRRHSTLVSFDVNHRPALWSTSDCAAAEIRDVATEADIVFVGRDEAARLWSTDQPGDVRELFPDVPHLVVKDADVQAIEYFTGGVASRPALEVEVVEPVGAGDAFAAGWLHGHLMGEPAVSRLEHGHTFAARTLSSTDDVPHFGSESAESAESHETSAQRPATAPRGPK